MAMVRLLQPTNMFNFSNDLAVTGVSPRSTEEFVYSTADGVFLSALGSFTWPDHSYPFGIVSEVLVDSGDSGSYPNLHITGLSYDLTAGAAFDVQSRGRLLNFVTALLSGSDTVIGSSNADTLAGFDGDDILIGGAGADVLDGGAGNNTASYSTAAAGLFAGLEEAGFNSGDALGDTYNAIDNLEGSAFNDFLYGSSHANRLSGGAGNDVLVGKGAGDSFFGGTGIDTVSYDSSDAVRADLLSPATNTGDAVGDTYSSIENLEGSAFDDILLGNNSANVLRGSSYPNLTSGNDRLYGRGGNDTLEGNDGDDRLDGGTGADTMKGGTGNDLYYVDNAADAVVELAGGGTADSVYASVDYVLSGLNVETLLTNSITGTAAIDLTGNAQANKLYGNAGNNILDGRGGSDTIKGYGGADSFVFRDALGASNIDTIVDFSVANDTIRLENAIFNAIVGTGTLTSGQFVANTSGTAQDSNDRIIYETDTGKLFYDSNGNAPGGATQFAAITPGLGLTNADFVVY
jgi:Ca2+-binding RTX toxin-like protein